MRLTGPKRDQFFMFETFGGTTIGHPALPDGEIECNKPDVLDLIDAGYLRETPGSNGTILDITRAGSEPAAFLRVQHALPGTSGGWS
jgi:hypothetical protein